MTYEASSHAKFLGGNDAADSVCESMSLAAGTLSLEHLPTLRSSEGLKRMLQNMDLLWLAIKKANSLLNESCAAFFGIFISYFPCKAKTRDLQYLPVLSI